MSDTPAAVESAPENGDRPKRRRFFWPVVILVLLAAAAAATSYYVVFRRPYEFTDNAFLRAEILTVAPQIAGRALQVPVERDQHVKAGDLLVEIDPAPFNLRLKNAQAALALAEGQLESARRSFNVTSTTTLSGVSEAEAELQASRSRVETARANAAAAAARAKNATEQAKRYRDVAPGAVAPLQRDAAVMEAATGQAELRAAQQAVASAEAAVQVAESQVEGAKSGPEQVAVQQANIAQREAAVAQAQVAVEQAELDLSYTRIFAPRDGRVTELAVREGEYLVPGQRTMALVGDYLWVEANFKETQLDRIRPGQLVDLELDAYPDLHLKGHVESLHPGTGAEFSLLPAQNATGNYVKVVQRLPVRILLEEQPAADDKHALQLASGMSVVPRVHVQ